MAEQQAAFQQGSPFNGQQQGMVPTGGGNALGPLLGLAGNVWDTLTAYKAQQTAQMLQQDQAYLQYQGGQHYADAQNAVAAAGFPTGPVQDFANAMLNLTAVNAWQQQNVQDFQNTYQSSESNRALGSGIQAVGQVLNSNLFSSGSALGGGGGGAALALGATGIGAALLLSNNNNNQQQPYGSGYGTTAGPPPGVGWPTPGLARMGLARFGRRGLL